MSAVRNVEAGIGFEEKGDYEKALKHYFAAVVKEENVPGGKIGLGNVYSRLKEYDKAEDYYRQILERKPDHAMANNNLAWILIVQGRNLGEAEERIRTAMYSDPDRVSFYLDTQAYLYLRERRIEDALHSIRSAENLLDLDDAIMVEQIAKTRSLVDRALELSRGGESSQSEHHPYPEETP